MDTETYSDEIIEEVFKELTQRMSQYVNEYMLRLYDPIEPKLIQPRPNV